MSKSSLARRRFHDPLAFDRSPTTLLRMRLVELIGSPPRAPITLVTAPAGFGKSTLALQWASESAHPVVWVSLDSESNSPARFLGDFEQALLKTSHRPTAGGEEPSVQNTILRLRGLVEHGPVTLIVDDYHLIENRDVHDIMNALIDGMPSTASMMILSRALPPLALAWLRVAGQVREVTEADLRFDPDEVAAIAAPESGGRLSPAQIARLNERTQGWIAGIRLVLISMRQVSDKQIDTTIESFSGNQWLDQYIVQEVLHALPERLRQFVLRTSSLGSLDPDFCNAVLEIEQSAAIIDELIKGLVFIRSDARTGAVATYHALFAECVEHIAARSISPVELRSLHSRAAAWLEQHGRLEEALDHALRIEDWPLARRIVRAVCQPLWECDFNHSLLYWTEKLPIEELRQDHTLLYWHIHKLFCVGRFRDAKVEQEVAEPIWQASENREELGFAINCRAFRAAGEANVEAHLYYSYRALHYYSQSDHVMRMRSWFSVSDREFMRGNDEIAAKAYNLAAYNRTFLPAVQRWWTLLIEHTRINQYALRGNLPAAERLYRVALERSPPEFRDAVGKHHVRLAATYLEWNELDRAQAEVDHFIDDPERFPWQVWHLESRLVAAQVAMAGGQLETAGRILNRLFEMAEERGETHTSARAQAVQAQLWLMQGEILLAGVWGDNVEIDTWEWAVVFGEADPYTVLIQVRIAQERYDEALLLATTRIAEGIELKRYAELVPLYIWQIVALRTLGRTEEAVDALRAAIRIAAPGRMVRSFFPPGTDLLPFFTAVAPHLESAEQEFLRMLLANRVAVVETSITQADPIVISALPEPLSLRELEVLGLLGLGLGNRQLAERLSIAESTVKKHLANVFLKLKVDNRLAAVTRARELGLLA